MKYLSKILSLLLAFTLLALPLSGCGSKDGEKESDDPEASAVWVPDFVSLPSEMGSFNCAAFSGDAVYVASTGVVTQTIDGIDALGQSSSGVMSSDSGAEPAIYKVSEDGKTSEALADYQTMTLPEGSEGSISINNICVDPEGFIWVYESAYSYHYELPEGFSGTDEEKQQYYIDDGQKYAMRKLSPTGAELVSIDLADIAGGSEYFNMTGFACDKDGNLYFSNGESKLFVFDKNGKQFLTLDVTNYIYALVALSDGSVGAESNGQSGYEVVPVDTAAKSWGEAIKINYPQVIYPGGGDYYFLYTLSSSLFGYNKETGESEKLFGWIDCDMDQDSVRSLTVRDDGSVLCACSADNEGELVALSKKEASAVTQKTKLTLATMSLGSGLRKQILKFNKTNDYYHIVVKDYSEFNTDGDYSVGITKMNTEIISGDVPDIIDISQLPVGQYASLGLLEDLYTYIDTDTELSRDSFVPTIQKALEINGGLYQASPGFGIFTVIGRSDVVGGDMGWTLDEMMECLAGQPEGTELFQQGITQDTILEYICYMYMNSFVDWQAKTCSFDSQEFIKLLEFCASFDKEFEYSEDTYESEVSRIQSGKQLLQITTEQDFQSFQMYEAMFGGEITYKGFPRENGIGNVAFVDSGLAMSTTCADKEGAWSFIRTLLTEEYQSGGDVWTFPTNQAAFDKSLAAAMEKETYIDESGKEVEVSKGGWGWDDLYVDMYAVTEEQAARMKALIDSVDGVLTFDTSMAEIIKDDAAAYFSGQKTAEETAKLIQSRVALYVSEQG